MSIITQKIAVALAAFITSVSISLAAAPSAQADPIVDPDAPCGWHIQVLNQHQGVKRGFVTRLFGSRGTRTDVRVVSPAGVFPRVKQEVRTWDNCVGGEFSIVFTKSGTDNWRLTGPIFAE